jgi:dTDP-4-dehydrorhamnose reductase
LRQLPVVQPIPASAYPTPARRPACSVLDKQSTWEALQRVPPHWRVQLRSMLQTLKESSDA